MKTQLLSAFDDTIVLSRGAALKKTAYNKRSYRWPALISCAYLRRQDQKQLPFAVDPLEFHWRTLVSFALELYLSSTGVPLENLSSTGAPGDDPGHGQAVPEPGHQTHG